MQRFRIRSNEALKERRYSYLQTPAKFIGEIHTILSAILIVTFTIVIIIFSAKEADTGKPAAYRIGVITYMSVALVGSVMDLVLAVFLIYSARMMSGSKCLFWWRCTFISILIFSLLSTCFCIMTRTVLLFLAVLPNAIFKPFALYVVGGFLGDLWRQMVKTKQEGPSLDAFELDMTHQDFVDSGSSTFRPTRPRLEPPGISLDEGDTTVYAESHPGKSDDMVTPPSGGDASLVQEILEEKFHLGKTKAATFSKK